MSDDSSVMTAAILGAVGGAVVGYLLFTDPGRALRRRFEATLEEAAAELNHFRGTATKTANLAIQGWNLLNEVIGDRGRNNSRPQVGGSQTAQF